MNASVDLVGSFQMMPENPMIIDGLHIMTGEHVIIHDPFKQATGQITITFG